MATITGLDYRRTDQRTNLMETPFWITSGLINGAAAEDLGAILFSFPKAGEINFIHMVVFEVVVAFTTGTTIDVGLGTIADDDTPATVTIVDLDEYIKNSDITVGTPGVYGSLTATTSDWLTAMIAGSFAAPFVLTGAASTVPVIYASLANSGTIAAGSGRVHVLLSKVPGT